MRAEIKLTDVKDIRDLHEYINAELRLRRVAPTLEALQAALEMPKTEAEIEFTENHKKDRKKPEKICNNWRIIA